MSMLVNLPSKQPGKLVEQILQAKQEKRGKLEANFLVPNIRFQPCLWAGFSLF